ncbi:CRISPR-associated protein (Cas_GSU0053) [Rosistilla ulvae]|uniref:CRISPR-associated protein (Cas_GSU0053) n=1 Tax=Rosistilla ulvae TaxID=1930277 RepID=A0A517LTH9_9BACT|nr:type I-U CRISPR-associated RAMP protein Csb1/Cas7u [Rosistilla ulvae]QDS85931.1 CRISPR-associated protein (Cas_GSU0053) [Rosistilla ulvae]
MPFDYSKLKDAVKTGAALRCRTKLQPAGGEGDKVFPPTYAGAVYAMEYRRVPGRDQPVRCVLMDSVQSQANRFEEALQDAVDDERIKIPVVEVDFGEIPIVEPGSEDAGLYEPIGRVTSLQAPHRVADAILRDSELDGVAFRATTLGKKLSQATLRNATPLLELCPTALIFGIWDSTGPKGGLGVKFQRALVSEIIGIDAELGVKTSSRIDPLAIQLKSGPVYEDKNGDWTLDANQARMDKKKPRLAGKDGKPSEVNHGNIAPSLSETGRDPIGDADRRIYLAGGVTIAYAEQTTVLSFPALRRLRFPPHGSSKTDADSNLVAQTALAALGVCSAALASERGLDLRSRCLLWPTEKPTWELLAQPGESAEQFMISADEAVALLEESIAKAVEAQLPWNTEPLVLKPAQKLVDLVRKSQELAVTSGAEDGGE